MLYTAFVITITLASACVALLYFFCSRRIMKKRKSMQIVTPQEKRRLRSLAMAGIILVVAICVAVIVSILGSM